MRGELRKAYEICRTASAAGTERERSSAIAHARHGALGRPRTGWENCFRPRAISNRQHALTNVPSAIGKPSSAIGPMTRVGSLLHWQDLLVLGYPDRALKRGDEALALARSSDPFSLVLHERWCCRRASLFDEPPRPLKRREEGAHCSRNRTWIQPVVGCRGTSHAWGGEGRTGAATREAIAQLREGLAAYRATGAE